MVGDTVGREVVMEGVILKIGAANVAGPATYKADNDISTVLDREETAFNGDAIAGRSLAGDGDVVLSDFEVCLEIDGARDAKEDGSVGDADTCAQGAGTGIVEICYIID